MRLAATNASASEHTHKMTGEHRHDEHGHPGFAASESSTDVGTATLRTAAARAPTTRNPQA